MESSKELRIDKFLWAVRIYKTRTIASEACSKGQVIINGIPVKPSRIIKQGETIIVRKPPYVNTYLVHKLLETRLSAQKIQEYIEEITPSEELMKREIIRMQKNAIRDKGAGRPTKKERREIDKFTGNS
jgi:ribosome-associated heat shock protein Hsp15